MFGEASFDERVELAGEGLVEGDVAADGVLDVVFGIKGEGFVGGGGDEGDDGLGVGAGHGEDDIGLVDEFDGEGSRAVAGEIDAEGLEGLYGGWGSFSVWESEAAGGEDGVAFVFEVGLGEVEFVGEDFAGEALGHGGAAGVAGADEEEGGSEESFDDAAVVDAVADDVVVMVSDSDDGGGFGVLGGSGVEDEVDELAPDGGGEVGVEGGGVGGVGGPADDDGAGDEGEGIGSDDVVGAAEGDGGAVVDFFEGEFEFRGEESLAVGGHIEDEGDGAGPEFSDHAASEVGEGAEVACGMIAVGEVDDEGLGGEGRGQGTEAGERGGVSESGGGAVDGFGGDDDELAAGEEIGGLADVRVVVAGFKELHGGSGHRADYGRWESGVSRQGRGMDGRGGGGEACRGVGVIG